jgi:hypothetical protein
MGDAFEHVKSQIGACGIWCGSCAVGNGSLRELSRRFEEVFEGYGVGHWAPPELDDAAFTAGLAIIRKIASCPGCRDGGGRADCEMKACTASRGHSECTECSDRATCPHSEIREEMRTGARDAGLFAETEDTDSLRSLAEWSLKLQVQWPSCILFLYDQDPGP